MSDVVERLKRGESCLQKGGQTCIRMVAENGCLCAIAADEITRLTAEVERLRAVLDILQAAMTAKKPIPLVFKKAITEARAALSGDKQ